MIGNVHTVITCSVSSVVVASTLYFRRAKIKSGADSFKTGLYKRQR